MSESDQLKLKANIEGKDIEILVDYADLDKYFEHYYEYRLKKNIQANAISDQELLRKSAEIFVSKPKIRQLL